MAKYPAFLFYPGDWLGGTMGMSLEQKGAYMELLILQFNVGHMTEDMIAQTVGQVWVKVQHKFRLDDNGLWYNERLDLEKEKRKNYVQSRSNNREGKNQYSKNSGHMTSHMENENENTISISKKTDKVSAKEFSEDGMFAVFETGEKQKLTLGQQSLLSMGELKPKQVVKES